MVMGVLTIPFDAKCDDDQITVTGERPERDQRNSAATIDVIKLDDDPRMRLDIGQHVDRALGARVQRSGSLGRGQVLQLRGAGSNQVLLLLEDIQFSGPRGDAIDLNSLPMGCLDQIDILRGSAGAYYGSGAQGGVLRLRLPKGALADRIEGGFGAFGYRYANGCVDLTSDTVRVLISGRYSAAQGNFTYQDTNGREQIRSNNHHQNGGGGLQVEWRTNPSRKWSLLTDIYEDQRGEPGSSESPSLTAQSRQSRRTARLTLDDSRLFNGSMRLRSSVGALFRSYEFEDPRTTFGLTSEEFSLSDYAVDSRTEIMVYPSERWFIQASGDGTYANAKTNGSGQARNDNRISGSIVGGLGWLPNESLELLLTNRVDMRTGRPIVLAPQFNAVWTAHTMIQLNAQIGRAFRDPSFDELYFRGPGISGNESLRPEDGWSGSLSVRLSTPKVRGLLVEFGIYAQRYDRLILFLPIDAFRVQASDELSADIAGSEARVRIPLGKARFELNHHYQWHQDQSGRPLPYRPIHRLNWLTDYRFEAITVYLSGLIQGIVKSDRFGYRELPSYATVSTGITWTIGAGFSLSAELQNAFDERQLFDVIHRPLPGRSGFINVRWTALDRKNHR